MKDETERLLDAYDELFGALNEEGIDKDSIKGLLPDYAQRLLGGAHISAIMEQIKEIHSAKLRKKYGKK